MKQTSVIFAASFAAASPTVKVYSDAKCTNLVQTINFNGGDTYQCADFTNQNAQGAILSSDFAPYGFNVWDSDYCAGDQAGGYVH